MRRFLFHTVAWTSVVLVNLLTWFYNISSVVGEWSINTARVLIAQAAVFLMRKADLEYFEERLAEETAQLELEKQNTELGLLATATKLKEHALEIGDWTDHHTEALNAIGNSLLNDCGWEEDDIHQYLKDVVESGTDLSYNPPDEEDL